MSEQRAPPSPPPQGPIGWLLSLAGRIIGLVIGALVLRVVLELAGLYFWWPQEGVKHIIHVVNEEQIELLQKLHEHPIRYEIQMLVRTQQNKVIATTDWIAISFERLFSKEVSSIALNILAFTFVTIMTRFIWLIITIPLLLATAVIGIVEGLLSRDLRRFRAENESVFMFYWSYKLATKVWYSMTMMLLTYPDIILWRNISPILIIYTYMTTRAMVRFYKKNI